jgi:hypothetical protein
MLGTCGSNQTLRPDQIEQVAKLLKRVIQFSVVASTMTTHLTIFMLRLPSCQPFLKNFYFDFELLATGPATYSI